ncbi:MAG TPA: curlin [Bauldia sp.]|nr:curlin [Bauldia sp.]
MTPTRTLRAALIAVALTGALAAPAAAGGSVSLTFTPQNQKQTRAVQTGLALYSIVKDVKGGASITQKGSGNSAGLTQQGRGNLGIIHQEGKGHSGTLQQNGQGNAFGLFQFGRKTDAAVTQTGKGNAGVAFQWGW